MAVAAAFAVAVALRLREPVMLPAFQAAEPPKVRAPAAVVGA